MFIEYLFLNHFRIYANPVSLSFQKPVVLLTGENGTGKTSLLEAICLLLSGKSFRDASDKTMVHSSFSNYQLALRLLLEGNAYKIELEYQKTKNKVFLLDGKKNLSIKKMLALFPLVFFTQEDKKIILEGPDWRRRWMDRLLSYQNPLYLEHLLAYHHANEQRNALLKSKDFSTMDFWEKEMHQHAFFLYQAREKAIQKLSSYFSDYFLPYGIEDFRIEYRPTFDPENFLKTLFQNRQKEQKMGFSTIGPHRDDFILLEKKGLLKDFASAGQIQAITFYLKIMQADFLFYENKKKSIVLLDDVFAELDRNNQKRVLSKIQNSGFQTFISSVNDSSVINLIKEIDGQIIITEKGLVKNYENQ